MSSEIIKCIISLRRHCKVHFSAVNLNAKSYQDLPELFLEKKKKNFKCNRKTPTALFRLFSFPDSSSEWLTAPEEFASSWESSLQSQKQGLRLHEKKVIIISIQGSMLLLLLWGPGCCCCCGLWYHSPPSHLCTGLRCVCLHLEIQWDTDKCGRNSRCVWQSVQHLWMFYQYKQYTKSWISESYGLSLL